MSLRSRLLVVLTGMVAAFVAQGCVLETGEEEEELETTSSEFASDSCSAAPAPKCPATSAPEGKGLVDIQRCAFPMSERFGSGAVLAALERMTTRVSLQQVLADANRTGKGTTSIAGGPPGVVRGFRWESDDDATSSWIPQGLTGSADATGGLAGGKNVLLSSWYDKDGAKGVRIAVVDATGKDSKYRFALLVNPTGTAAAPSFEAVKIHAGGLAWFGDYLYVADTSKGFRVFDMSRILRIEADSTKSVVGCSGGKCKAFDYRYVIPQIGAYTTVSKCSPRFSFVSVDRSTSPPSLLSGEWCDGKACPALGGRLFRWELNPTTGRINRAYPKEAWLMGQRQVQGAASDGGRFYLTSSAPKGTTGALYRVDDDGSKTSRWANGPEDLMVDRANDLLYSQTEYSPRAIFAVKQSSYPPP